MHFSPFEINVQTKSIQFLIEVGRKGKEREYRMCFLCRRLLWSLGSIILPCRLNLHAAPLPITLSCIVLVYGMGLGLGIRIQSFEKFAFRSIHIKCIRISSLSAQHCRCCCCSLLCSERAPFNSCRTYATEHPHQTRVDRTKWNILQTRTHVSFLTNHIINIFIQSDNLRFNLSFSLATACTHSTHTHFPSHWHAVWCKPKSTGDRSPNAHREACAIRNGIVRCHFQTEWKSAATGWKSKNISVKINIKANDSHSIGSALQGACNTSFAVFCGVWPLRFLSVNHKSCTFDRVGN